MEASPTASTGVIVVAEPSVHDFLASSGATWNVQERQSSAADMWAALSAGRLDARSRVLVFSDSLRADTPDDDSERTQTARALVAMAHAGAHVFIVVWRRESWDDFERRIRAAASAQGVDPDGLIYHALSPDHGGRALLDTFWEVLRGEVTFPDDFRPDAEAPLTRSSPSAREEEEQGAEEPLPTEEDERPDQSGAPGGAEDDAPVTVTGEAEPVVHSFPSEPSPQSLAPPADATGVVAAPTSFVAAAAEASASAARGEYPASASLELLGLPKRPGHTTITVTSSKGGSGKSTASVLLAGSIARASAAAGHPLSVCLIDLDTRDGQVASLIGKLMPTALNLRVQPVWDEQRIRRNLVPAEGLGIDTLLAPIRPRTAEAVGPDFYRTIVRSLQRMYDVVVIDTSVQYLDPLVAEVALAEADEILFVTTLASTSVQGMARALREFIAPHDESGLGIPRERIGILVNQSVADVGMERDQVLAAGLGVSVIGVIPLATKDVLTAANLNRMGALLDHPLLGPSYNELSHACLPNHELAAWSSTTPTDLDALVSPTSQETPEEAEERPVPLEPRSERRGLFRR